HQGAKRCAVRAKLARPQGDVQKAVQHHGQKPQGFRELPSVVRAGEQPRSGGSGGDGVEDEGEAACHQIDGQAYTVDRMLWVK
ncbi:unnamed protein product, partial [Ectocarpus sp. 12 AP-2014]